MNKEITYRQLPENFVEGALNSHPVLDRVYATRGIESLAELERDLKDLLPFDALKGIDQAVDRLFYALKNQERVLIVGDYDADGATSTTIAIRALRAFGLQHVNYLVPNRFEYGYGLSVEIVELAAQQKPDLIITVDNGIVSFAGVDKANSENIDVIITDHHLAEEQVPAAVAILNPNQPGDEFESKNLAGCGVAFYLMLALRAKLRAQDWFKQQNITEPNLAGLLDIVALGTVADVVPLDKNNRILVHQGLRRIRAGKCIPGIKSLLALGKRELHKLTATDLAFAVAPRLNAAGRLDDMSVGIECLLTDDPEKAKDLASQLDQLNQERRVIEEKMKQQAFTDLSALNIKADDDHRALCLYDGAWHQGVIGILASRVKDRLHRPVVVFANGDEGQIKGSARSIQGYHIRDAFDRVSKVCPGLILKFGGHAMAAGLSIPKARFAEFQQALLDDAKKYLAEEALQNKVVCDGELLDEYFTLDFAEMLRFAGPWGQNFPEPLFKNRFSLIDQRIVGEKHLKLTLALDGKMLDGILFFADLEKWPNHRCEYVNAAYRLDINEFRGRRSVQLLVEYLEAC